MVGAFGPHVEMCPRARKQIFNQPLAHLLKFVGRALAEKVSGRPPSAAFEETVLVAHTPASAHERWRLSGIRQPRGFPRPTQRRLLAGRSDPKVCGDPMDFGDPMGCGDPQGFDPMD